MTFPQHHHGPTQRAAGQSRPGPEPEGMSVRGIMLIAIGLLAAIAIAMIAVWLLESPMADQRSAAVEPSAPTPWARDWVRPGTELEQVLARAQERLETSAWVDEEAGIACIEIEAAMEIIAERGWPDEEGDR